MLRIFRVRGSHCLSGQEKLMARWCDARQFVLLLGLAITFLVVAIESAGDVFTVAAVGVGVSLNVATILDGSAGIRTFDRTDILMLWALFGLTLLEFLFPQPKEEIFDAVVRGGEKASHNASDCEVWSHGINRNTFVADDAAPGSSNRD